MFRRESFVRLGCDAGRPSSFWKLAGDKGRQTVTRTMAVDPASNRLLGVTQALRNEQEGKSAGSVTTQVGTITRINQRTATIDTGNGHTWRVGFALLRHVVDV